MHIFYQFHLAHGYKELLSHRCCQLLLILILVVSFYFAFCKTSTILHLLDLLRGRVSIILTISPICASLFSSCAWNFFDFFTNFPYLGCLNLRSTVTVMVFSILSLETTPVLVLRCFLFTSLISIFFTR